MMLLRFWVANHASIRKEQELSLVALDPRPEAPAARTLGSGVQVLPVAGIFGANASGKSKIVEALQFMRSAVVLSHQRWLPEQRIRRQPFLLDQSSRTRPSRFEVEIALGGVRYRYGFTCDDTRFREEWLHAYPKNRRRALFERADDGSIKFGEHLVGEREAIRRVTRSNSLFLSAAAANNHEQLSEVHRWFAEDLRVAVAGNAGGRLGETLHIYKEHERDDVLRLLRFADLGIDEVEIGTRDVSDAERRLITDLIRLRLPDGEKFDPASVELSKISLRHGTQFLPIEAESSGTRTWLELIGPIVSTLRHGDLLVVDELDARLHPSLAGHLVKLFQDPDTNPRGAQLVFNTHDVTLLGPNTPARLRRDEIWLTEKDPKTGATRLFPLTEYRIRDSLDNVERAYLRGRYGAVPFIDETLVVALGEAR